MKEHDQFVNDLWCLKVLTRVIPFYGYHLSWTNNDSFVKVVVLNFIRSYYKMYTYTYQFNILDDNYVVLFVFLIVNLNHLLEMFILFVIQETSADSSLIFQNLKQV